MSRRVLAIALAALSSCFDPAHAGSDGTWSSIALPTHVRALTHSAVHDPVGRRLLYVSLNPPLCWQLSLDDRVWTPIYPAGGPPSQRDRFAMAFDRSRNRVIVHGGWDGGLLADLWELVLDPAPSWRRLAPTGTIPGARSNHTLTYDGASDRLILFGGSNDVFSLDLAQLNWTQIVPSGQSPAARQGPAVALDSAGRRLVIFGGGTDSYLNDLWTLSLDGPPTWQQLTAQGTSPRERLGATIVHDPVDGKLYLFGGFTCCAFGGSPSNETWSFDLDGDSSWDSLSTSGPLPPPRKSHGAAYDPSTRSMLVFGGVSGYIRYDSWRLALDDAQWSPVSGPMYHLDLAFHNPAIHDPVRNRLVVFGIEATTSHGVTSALSLTSPRWDVLTSGYGPPGDRRGFSAIYDARRDRMVLFGGREIGHPGPPMLPRHFDEVWTLSLAGSEGWTQLHPVNAGSGPRAYHSAIYDPVGDRMIVLGGELPTHAGFCPGPCDGVTHETSVWALSFDDLSWSELPADGLLASRLTALFDPDANRIVHYGGVNTYTFCGDCGHPCCSTRKTYLPEARSLELEQGASWQAVATNGDPPPRPTASIVLDDLRRRMLVWGGRGTNGSPLSELWALGLAGPSTWTLLATQGTPPPVSLQDSYVEIYDPYSDALWLHDVDGGATWKLQFDTVTPVQVSRAGLTASWNRVSLTWLLRDTDSASVERHETGGQGIPIAGIGRRDGDWRVVDDRVVPGARYKYRLIVWSAGRMWTADEAWIDVPARPMLELHGVHPNPSTGELRASISLAGQAPVVLEIVDVTGRCLVRRNVGTLGEGRHSVDLSPGSAVPAGVYFVRLTHEGKGSSRRVAVVR